MRLSEFDYQLPEDCIAQQPTAERDQSRLLVVPADGESLLHLRFSDIRSQLRPGDLLVVNQTKVIPARIHGHKETGGKVELLLDRPLQEVAADGSQEWAGLVRASKPLRTGAKVLLPAGAEAVSLGRTAEKAYRLRLDLGRAVVDYLKEHGHVPLPAYIRRQDADDPRGQADRSRYQTVYAQEEGAVAAPTAGLHFTTALLEQLTQDSVELARVTLHVGPGTFLPVRTDEVDAHRMHAERYRVSDPAARAVRSAKADGRRVVAVGTTVVRTLEGAWDDGLGGPKPGTGTTDLFIRPGYDFKAVDALVTNFHLPKSTLLMLVCAFAGQKNASFRHTPRRSGSGTDSTLTGTPCSW